LNDLIRQARKISSVPIGAFHLLDLEIKQIFFQNIDSGQIYEDLKLINEDFIKIYQGMKKDEAIFLIKI
jgi:hypothetical protein